MQFYFEGVVRVTAEAKHGDTKSRHVSTDLYLECSPGLDEDKYIDKDDVMTKDGAHALSQVLIQGLVAHIHFCHQKGFRNDAEHLRYIISELDRGFVQMAQVSTGKF